jgi:hypothetical protein
MRVAPEPQQAERHVMAQEMVQQLHPAASDHLPIFITAPGSTDALMVVTALILFGAVVGFGILFLTLHTLPERMAHKSQKLQFEIVAVLGLLALFTHQHIFWVAGLLLAVIDLPDIGGWMGRIAGSVERIADTASAQGQKREDVVLDGKPAEGAARIAPENVASLRRGEGIAPARPELAPAGHRG